MTLLQVITLAVVQGLTEFLPVSSSAHLVLIPVFAGWRDQGLTMDIAVHVGTLFAVMLYFRRDMKIMALGVIRSPTGRGDPGARLFWLIVFATLPVLAAGFTLKEILHPQSLRSVAVIGWAMVGFGAALWACDKAGAAGRRVEHMTLRHAIIIGAAQALALIPGASRSGVTMTAARALGYDRDAAARFSMLMSIPTILGAGTLAAADLWNRGDAAQTADLAIAAALAFISALFSIALMMAFLRRSGFTPYVIYRFALGALLLAVAYGLV